MFRESSLINIKTVVQNGRSNLYIYEKLPFELKRAFWFSNLDKEEIRGNHAHKKTEQLLIPVKGNFFVTSLSPLSLNDRTDCFYLNNASIGLYVPPYNWITLENFSKDCTVLVLTSEHYDKEDYINDFEEFKSLAKHSI